jgi:hypothetical protein
MFAGLRIGWKYKSRHLPCWAEGGFFVPKMCAQSEGAMGAILFAVFWLERDPDADRGGEFAGFGFANIDAFCRHHLAISKGEAGPWFGHPVERHFLQRLTGYGVHNGCGNSHVVSVAGGWGACLSTAVQNYFSKRDIVSA